MKKNLVILLILFFASTAFGQKKGRNLSQKDGKNGELRKNKIDLLKKVDASSHIRPIIEYPLDATPLIIVRDTINVHMISEKAFNALRKKLYKQNIAYHLDGGFFMEESYGNEPKSIDIYETTSEYGGIIRLTTGRSK